MAAIMTDILILNTVYETEHFFKSVIALDIFLHLHYISLSQECALCVEKGHIKQCNLTKWNDQKQLSVKVFGW